MKPIRFYIAMLVARASFFMLRLIGRNATHLPGVLAVKIYPEILKYLEIAHPFVAITGTNGKTTTTNLVLSFLDAKNVNYVSNQMGSNIEGGIISALLTSTTFFGKNKRDLTVFEIDERASLYIFPYLKPKLLLITNLFRDSYTRNAHVEYIVETLEESIPPSTKLILNGDDILTSTLTKNKERVYFSIAPQKDEIEIKDSIIQDGVYCPICEAPLDYDFQRHHHIGQVHCENCGYRSPIPNFSIKVIDENFITFEEKDVSYKIKKFSDNMTDHYNLLAAIALLREMGYSIEELSTHFSNVKITESRYQETLINGRHIVSILAKDQNPVANSRVFDFIRNQKEWGTKTVVFLNEEYPHHPLKILENSAWIYDANFEYLNEEDIHNIYMMGHRTFEYKSRMLLAGIDEKKLHILEPSESLDIPFDTDSIILLNSTKNIPIAHTMIKKIEMELKHEN